MQQKCKNLKGCGFFNNFKGNNEVISEGWIKLYCENENKSQKCERKIIKEKTGKAPVDNMTPTGKLL
ncbi:MAG: hypothetical protein CR986_07545 [Ignavibacteriae bacterium]|nr:MAG: hypothetical protein CR986_07545 [Ignavibacteriota bacterium]